MDAGYINFGDYIYTDFGIIFSCKDYIYYLF